MQIPPNLLCKCKDIAFRPVSHVIFDLDGVVLNTEIIYQEAFRKTLKYYGFEYTEELYQLASGRPGLKVAEVIINKLNLRIPVEDVMRKYRSYSWNSFNAVQTIKGAEDLIRHLYINRIPLAIATSSAKESFLLKTAEFNDLIEMFHHVVCGDDPCVVHGKPEPDIYLICASRFPRQPLPSECLVFEDSENGMKAALAAGMQVVIIPNKAVPKDVWKLATCKIDSFNQIKLELFGLPPIH